MDLTLWDGTPVILTPRPEFAGYDIGAGYDANRGTFYGFVFDRSGDVAAELVNIGDAHSPIGNPKVVIDALLPYLADQEIAFAFAAALCEQVRRSGDRFTESGALACRDCGTAIGEADHRPHCPRYRFTLPLDQVMC